MSGVEAAELGRRMVAHEPGSVGGALQGVVVDDDQPAVRRQVDVALDEIASGLDSRAERPHRVLGMVGRVAPMATQQWAALVVRVFVAIAYGLSQAPVSLTAFET